MLGLDAVIFQPCADVIRQTASAGIMDGEAFADICVRSEPGNGRKALTETASAVGASGLPVDPALEFRLRYSPVKTCRGAEGSRPGLFAQRFTGAPGTAAA